MGFKFPYCYNTHFGQYPDEPKVPDNRNNTHRGYGWISTEGDINSLIKVVSGKEVNGVLRGGGSIATCSLTNDNRNTDNLLYYGAIALDIDAKNIPIDLKNSLIPTPEEIRGQTSFGKHIGAMFPTGSAEPEVHSMVGRIIIPLEKPIGSVESGSAADADHKIQNLLYHLYLDLLQAFPSLHKEEVEGLLRSMDHKGGSGGIDFSGLTAVQYWAGMRPNQSPFYVNDEAYLPQSFIDSYPQLSPDELQQAINVMKRKKNSFGGGELGSRREKRTGSNFSSSSNDQQYFKNINVQIIDDVEWLMMNVLPPPGQGTYDVWFSNVEHFCCTHAEYFGDLFINYCERSDHRMRSADPRYKLTSGTWKEQGWSKLAEALDYIDPDWEQTFFDAHGRYCSYSRRRPRNKSYLRPMHLWILNNAT